MSYEKIVLQSAKPLEGNVSDSRKFYLIAAGCGLGLGIVLSLVGGVINIGVWVFLALLTTLIGWGFRNKQLKYKCFGLRNMRFLVDKKPSGQELYQRLFSVFSSLNMKVEMTKNGNISIALDGVYYDVVFNEDDSFSIHWHQSFAKAFLRQGYYISLYKKALAAMGTIAYHVQKVCLDSGEMYCEPIEFVPETVADNAPIPQKQEKSKQNLFLVIAVSIVAGIIGLYLIVSVLGAIVGFFYSAALEESDDSVENYSYYEDVEAAEYASVIEDYPCDIGAYSKAEIYALIDNCTADYCQNGTVNFANMTNWRAGLRFNEYMRYNEDYIGTGMVLEGEIKAKVGNIVEIYDMPTFDEYVQIGETGYTGTNVDIRYGADISLTGKAVDEFYEGDQVKVIGVYCGKINLGDGEYTPAIVAIDMYTTNDYY